MAGNTVDRYSGLEIRRTDNGMKEGDIESPQVARLLTPEEIEELISKGEAGNGDG